MPSKPNLNPMGPLIKVVKSIDTQHKFKTILLETNLHKRSTQSNIHLTSLIQTFQLKCLINVSYCTSKGLEVTEIIK